MQTKLLINGKLIDGDVKIEDVLDPATGKKLTGIKEASTRQIDLAVKAAEAALAGWCVWRIADFPPEASTRANEDALWRWRKLTPVWARVSRAVAAVFSGIESLASV